MSRGRNRKKRREAKEIKYETVTCPECSKSLYMKKNRKPRCPNCRNDRPTNTVTPSGIVEVSSE